MNDHSKVMLYDRVVVLVGSAWTMHVSQSISCTAQLLEGPEGKQAPRTILGNRVFSLKMSTGGVAEGICLF
jgi:hypothetical protein